MGTQQVSGSALPLVVESRPDTPVEKAFMRAKARMIKRETKRNSPGLSYVNPASDVKKFQNQRAARKLALYSNIPSA